MVKNEGFDQNRPLAVQTSPNGPGGRTNYQSQLIYMLGPPQQHQTGVLGQSPVSDLVFAVGLSHLRARRQDLLSGTKTLGQTLLFPRQIYLFYI